MACYFMTDPHFGHENILKFRDYDGNPLRGGFENIEDHDEYIIQEANKVVRPTDRLYVMGDVAMKQAHIEKIARINGKKVLIRGNHDIFQLSRYSRYFEDVRACKVLNVPQESGGGRVVVTHIPVHTCELLRFRANVHGHLHANRVKLPNDENDGRYINLCPEIIGYVPKSLEEIYTLLPERAE